MRILQINTVYPSGSTGKIVKSLHEYALKHGHESFVFYGRGPKLGESSAFKVSGEAEAKLHSLMSRLFSADFAYSPAATANIIGRIKRMRPDAVHLHCLNGHFVNAYRLIGFLKKMGIKTVLTLHAEIMHTAGCEHAVDCRKWLYGCTACPKVEGKISKYFRDDARFCYERMKRSLGGFNRLVCVGVSDWLTKRAERSPLLDGIRIKTIYNGVDTSVFKYDFYAASAARRSLDLDLNRPFILHVTPDFKHPIKGGVHVIKLAELMPDSIFVILGYNADKNGLPKNIVPIGRIADQHRLAGFYSAAQAVVLTSVRETFSMVCAESLCCGTPVAGFKAGGPESIALTGYSSFCEQGDYEGLINAVNECQRLGAGKEEISRISCREYSNEKMCAEYFKLYAEG